MTSPSRCRITPRQVPESRPWSTDKMWVVAHLPWDLSRQQQSLVDLRVQFFPNFQLPQPLVQWHRPALTWTTQAETQLIYLCVYSVGIDIWSRHPERAAFRAQFIWSSLDVCFLMLPTMSLSPLWQHRSLHTQRRHVQMEPSEGWGCAQPFSWSSAKGLLWLGVSDNYPAGACAICSCGCLLLKR